MIHDNKKCQLKLEAIYTDILLVFRLLETEGNLPEARERLHLIMQGTRYLMGETHERERLLEQHKESVN